MLYNEPPSTHSWLFGRLLPCFHAYHKPPQPRKNLRVENADASSLPTGSRGAIPHPHQSSCQSLVANPTEAVSNVRNQSSAFLRTYNTHTQAKRLYRGDGQENSIEASLRTSLSGANSSSIWHCTHIPVAHSACHRNGVRREAFP